MTANPRACADRVWVDVDRRAGSGYLGQDEVVLELSCRRLGCAWMGPTWDPLINGPLGVDDLLEFQKAHDQWVEETERVQFRASVGSRARHILLDGVEVGSLTESVWSGGYHIAWHGKTGGAFCSTLTQVRDMVEHSA